MVLSIIVVIILYMIVLNNVYYYKINSLKMLCINNIKNNDIVIKLIQNLYIIKTTSKNKYYFEYIICNHSEPNIRIFNNYINLFLTKYIIIYHRFNDISLNNNSLYNLYEPDKLMNETCIIYKFHLQK
jgi:hypothetical protein